MNQAVLRAFRIELEFDGSGFEGWQRQDAARTVQGEVERALERILGERHAVVGCGRTDTGVHARGMVASFRTGHGMPAADLERALDAVLPADIGVRRLADADPGFHAQRDSIWKWYRYTVLVSRRKRPLVERSAWRVPRAPSLAQLQRVAAMFEGTHDFASFANAGSTPGPSTVRTVYAARWTGVGDLLRFDVVGNGFLYKMVRTMVGTSLQAASEADLEPTIMGILAAQDRRAAGRAAPPRGLCLVSVGFGRDRYPSWVPTLPAPDVESAVRRQQGGVA